MHVVTNTRELPVLFDFVYDRRLLSSIVPTPFPSTGGSKLGRSFQEIKSAHLADVLDKRQEDEMDLSDEDDSPPPKTSKPSESSSGGQPPQTPSHLF